MNEPKPFASLSSGLLARKGAAKPAMRPQGFTSFGGGLEDLGWNDMGSYAPNLPETFEEPQEHVPSSISALTPAPRPNKVPLNLSSPDFDPGVEEEEEVSEEPQEEFQPTPAEQQRAIAESFSAELPAAQPAESVPAQRVARVVALPSKPRQAPGLKDKSAFTLRLDADRHLKLRLACAVRHRSAQQIVTDALDQFLQSLPELDALAGQLPVRAGKKN